MKKMRRIVSGLPLAGLPWPQRETWLALLLFTVLTLVLAYPLSVHPATLRFPTGPDGDLGWYLLGWNAHAFLNQPWAIFDANIYHPERLTLAYGENLIGIALFVAPIVWLTDNLLLAANVGSLLSCILCGLGAYVLARRVGLSVAAALVCGIVFECAPPRFFRIGQINLSNVQWIPFGLAALHGYFEEGRKRDLRLAAGFVSLQALSSGHGAAFMGVSLLAYGLYRALLGEPLHLMARVRDLGVTGVALLVPTLFIFIPYRIVQQEVGLRRGLGTWERNYESFLASPSHLHKLLLSVLDRTDINTAASSYLFPGYVPLVLAAIAVGLGSAGLARRIAAARPVAWGPAWTAARSVYARPVAWLVIGAASWMLLDATRDTLPAGTGLRGQYYANAKWDGPPVMSVVDRGPSTIELLERWNNEPPPTFSIAWTGYVSIVRPGLYFFATTSLDRSRLYIDDVLVVNNTGGHENGQPGSIQLTGGPHRVLLEYEHEGGRPGLKWEWVYSGDTDKAYKIVPTWALSRQPVGAAGVAAARLVDWLRGGARLLFVLAAIWCVLALAVNHNQPWIRSLAGLRGSPLGFYLVLTVLCIGLALGPPYGLWQYVYWLPGFNLIRGVSRFMIVGLLGFAILAAIGFDRITAGWARRRRVIFTTAIAVLLVAEYAAMPTGLGIQPATIQIPAIDRWLDGLPKPFVIAEAPAAGELEQATFMLHSTAHWQKTVHGYSGWRTWYHDELYTKMRQFPDEASIAGLSDFGVKYVVVHSDWYAPDEWVQVERRLRQHSSRLRLEHVEGAGRVYSLLDRASGAAR